MSIPHNPGCNCINCIIVVLRTENQRLTNALAATSNECEREGALAEKLFKENEYLRQKNIELANNGLGVLEENVELKKRVKELEAEIEQQRILNGMHTKRIQSKCEAVNALDSQLDETQQLLREERFTTQRLTEKLKELEQGQTK